MGKRNVDLAVQHAPPETVFCLGLQSPVSTRRKMVMQISI